jgi:hypothetical protein
LAIVLSVLLRFTATSDFPLVSFGHCIVCPSSIEEGQTIQWQKEEGQTIQWPKEEGQTIQWLKEGQKDKQRSTKHYIEN